MGVVAETRQIRSRGQQKLEEHWSPNKQRERFGSLGEGTLSCVHDPPEDAAVVVVVADEPPPDETESIEFSYVRCGPHVCRILCIGHQPPHVRQLASPHISRTSCVCHTTDRDPLITHACHVYVSPPHNSCVGVTRTPHRNAALFGERESIVLSWYGAIVRDRCADSKNPMLSHLQKSQDPRRR